MSSGAVAVGGQRGTGCSGEVAIGDVESIMLMSDLNELLMPVCTCVCCLGVLFCCFHHAKSVHGRTTACKLEETSTPTVLHRGRDWIFGRPMMPEHLTNVPGLGLFNARTLPKGWCLLLYPQTLVIVSERKTENQRRF